MLKNTTELSRQQKIQKLLFIIMGVLICVLLILSACTNVQTYHAREEDEYMVMEEVVHTKIKDATAPTGVVNEYRFRLDKIQPADTLTFAVSHHDIEVYMEDVCVYRLMREDGVIATVGSIWAMIPLYPEDAGKEIRVLLMPLYENYQDLTPEFLVGSDLAIHKSVIYRSLPEIVLSMCSVVIGLVLLGLAFFYNAKWKQWSRLCAIGIMLIASGIWRFTYGNVINLLLPNYSVMIYTISVISLMVIAIALLYAVDFQKDKKKETGIRVLSYLYSVIYSIQMLLQVMGVCDLRQMLPITHLTLIVSAVILCVNSIVILRSQTTDKGGILEHNNSWMLSLGIIMDLLLYYYGDSNSGMICTLCAIVIFSLLEGAKLLFAYMNQQIALEKTEKTLILNRTTMMMSQIRSHFVFNILNAISGMCKYDPEKADDIVVRFARYLRNNINILEDDKLISFKEDIRHLEDYVALEQVRMGDKFRFVTEIETDEFELPPLILQPVVENAIKHGIWKKETNGTITLRTRNQGETIAIMVEDDGVGFDMEELEKEKSVGIKNIRFRLKHLVNGTLEITSQKNVGTIVTILVPKTGADVQT